jgi:hypothetical protein
MSREIAGPDENQIFPFQIFPFHETFLHRLSEARWLTGGYSVDYLRHLVVVLYELLGVYAANDVIRTAMRLPGVQFTAKFAQAIAETGTDRHGRLLEGQLHASR